MEFDVTIGLETHVQLKTNTKIWCGCKNEFGGDPNTHCCPVCLGYPGTLPVLNKEAVELTVRTGLLLGCTISRFSKWDRKSYFYPDMPKNYQISQFDVPLCLGGTVDIEVDGVKRPVQVNRIHLEEDVGKSTHLAGHSGLDYNRAGTPLMEIVTEPDLHSPDEVMAYLQNLRTILLYGEVTHGNLEEGNIRCDVNCSLKPKGQQELGTKTELKNMNSFHGIYKALQAEIARQSEVLNSGGTLQQETRRWDEARGMTLSMRSKEYAHDYRYMPDPDLLPVMLNEVYIAKLKADLPELPQARKERFLKEYGLPEYDAGVLVADKLVAEFFEQTTACCKNPKVASNWIMTEVLRVLSEENKTLSELKLTPENLGGLIRLLDGKEINQPAAKKVFAVLLDEGGEPTEHVVRMGLKQVSDTGAIDDFAQQAIEANPKAAGEYASGKGNALQFLVGQVMRLSRGKANPQMAAEALKHLLDA